jgi:lipoate-protein ligase A
VVTGGHVKLLDLTLETPEENLALDEALLDEADEAGRPTEVLRLWEPTQPIVVVGRSSRVSAEVDCERCRQMGITILRRCSGGATVLTGPGCLMYALVLSYERRPALRMISEAHRFVLESMSSMLASIVSGVQPRGTSDLTVSGRKFSGNSMRAKRTHLLYHGTLLYDLPLGLIAKCLRMPPRQPDYRQERSHDDFLTNLPTSAGKLRSTLKEGWRAQEPLRTFPRSRTQELVHARYSKQEWNLRSP